MSGSMARYDGIADFYDEKAGQSIADPATAGLLDLVGDVSGLRLLEVACGQGRVVRELARRGAHVTGVDISSVLLGLARAYEAAHPCGVRYIEADVSAGLTLDEPPFDGVVCNFGVTDVDDLDGLLGSVASVLRSGGWFVFSLLHPCFPGWDRDAPSSWHPDRGYYAEGWWLADNPGFRGKVGASHRMLSTYLNALTAHGFTLEHAAEPPPGPAWQQRLPGAAPVPVYLVIRCRRH